jgi:hypothetical protein
MSRKEHEAALLLQGETRGGMFFPDPKVNLPFSGERTRDGYGIGGKPRGNHRSHTRLKNHHAQHVADIYSRIEERINKLG